MDTHLHNTTGAHAQKSWTHTHTHLDDDPGPPNLDETPPVPQQSVPPHNLSRRPSLRQQLREISRSPEVLEDDHRLL